MTNNPTPSAELRNLIGEMRSLLSRDSLKVRWFDKSVFIERWERMGSVLEAIGFYAIQQEKRISELEAENAKLREEQGKKMRQAIGAIKIGIRLGEELNEMWEVEPRNLPGDVRLKIGKMKSILASLS